MANLDLVQAIVIQKKVNGTTNAQPGPLNNGRNLGNNAPNALLLCIHTDQGRNQPSQTISHTGQKQFIKQPDVIRHVPQRQAGHTNSRNGTHDGRNDEERHVFDASENSLGGFAGKAAGFVLVFDGLLDRGKGSGKDEEASEKEPDEEGGEDVVGFGDVVLVEQHLDVAGVHCVGAFGG